MHDIGYTPVGREESGACDAASEGCGADSNMLCDRLECRSVIFPGLISEAEEDEEDEGAENIEPAIKLQGNLKA